MRKVVSFAVLAPTQSTEPAVGSFVNLPESRPAKSESCWAGLAGVCAASVFGCCVGDILGLGKRDISAKAQGKTATPKSWYSVRQQHGSDLFVVQAVPDPKNNSASCSASCNGMRRTKSFSEEALRETDAAEPSMCQICYAQPADSVMLPCRHGDICSSCVRRAMFMKPLHKGGGSCPLCRRKIKQVVRVTGKELDAPSILPRHGEALTSWGRAC